MFPRFRSSRLYTRAIGKDLVETSPCVGLNHAERDVTAVYDRHSHDPEKRPALEAWGRRLEAIISGTVGKAVSWPSPRQAAPVVSYD